MLSDNEKKAIRILIAANPRPEYMEQISNDDDFARNEIKNNATIIIEQYQRENTADTDNATILTERIAKRDAAIKILEDAINEGN